MQGIPAISRAEKETRPAGVGKSEHRVSTCSIGLLLELLQMPGIYMLGSLLSKPSYLRRVQASSTLRSKAAEDAAPTQNHVSLATDILKL